jgi:hypothetical protein
MDVNELRGEFIRLMTVDGPTNDRRRKDYNQAIFDPTWGWAVFQNTDLFMVLDKFERAIKNLDRR